MKKKTNPHLKKKVKAVEVGKKTISQLLDAMAETGFQGKKLGEIAQTWERMIKDKDLTIILGYAASLSTTGQWKIINWLIENRFIDVLVGTGANLSEDIVEAMGFSYWQGSHLEDDHKLFREGFNRYYDVYGREDDYLKMTELIADFYVTNLKPDHPYSSREIFHLFGRWLWQKGIKSIVATAAHCGVPIFCPAIVDSPYGDAGLIAKSKGFNLIIDNMKDYIEFMSLGTKIKDSGVIYIGGGVPKDFIQLLAVTADLLFKNRKIPDRKDYLMREGTNETYYPHKYALQITTDAPQWGGLSGCTFEEAMSWGKEKTTTPKVQCYCDATIALPLVSHAIFEKVKKKRRGTNFSSLFKS
ncbi:MAG: deoxyhypusine synthase [Candidatus Wildermuthbacteria bacterium GWA2_46_15]|uniref:Deoxyhypusine synthase n=1 Tax=Candidatus Wildermuthbacteria bacterium GWA2_46_15 TaxID=1802443 RepID=A0A1G2QPT7_9BACT|nr:MAG: deoxyhypusine synthase [Candidatus Wildermuthbacteria bacterium GWA2_46_15]